MKPSPVRLGCNLLLLLGAVYATMMTICSVYVSASWGAWVSTPTLLKLYICLMVVQGLPLVYDLLEGKNLSGAYASVGAAGRGGGGRNVFAYAEEVYKTWSWVLYAACTFALLANYVSNGHSATEADAMKWTAASLAAGVFFLGSGAMYEDLFVDVNASASSRRGRA